MYNCFVCTIYFSLGTLFRHVPLKKQTPSQTVQFQTRVSPGTHPNGQLRGDVTRPPSRVLGVEVGLGAAQEGRFEDVSAAAVGKEAALVQVHLLPWSLEVESHCAAAQGELVSGW